MSVNKVILLGRLGQDPELKYTPGGAAVCNFSMATTEAWTDKQGQKQEKTELDARLYDWQTNGDTLSINDKLEDDCVPSVLVTTYFGLK